MLRYYPTPEELTMYRLRGYDIMSDGPGIDGTRRLFECILDGKLHREEGPAVIWDDGELWWYQHGNRHREDGPAIIRSVGMEWCQHNKFHREDGPAFVRPNGRMVWYQDGKFHREDGPAIISSDGKVIWYQHGRLNRDDGPAVIHPDGYLEWWLGSFRYQTREEWEHELEKRRESC